MFSILLACALVLGMMPMGVFAGTTATASNENELKNAIEGATGQITIKLENNIVLDTADVIELDSNKNVTIDGNDNTITFPGVLGTGNGGYAFHIANAATNVTLELKNVKFVTDGTQFRPK